MSILQTDLVQMDLLQMSFSGAVLIILITVIRAVLMNKLPKKTFLLLWGLVLLRLMVPFSIPASFSVYSLFWNAPVETSEWTDAPILSLLQEQAEIFEEDLDGAETIIGETYFKEGSLTDGLFSLWETIWLCGFLLLGVLIIICYAVCLRNFKTSLPLQTDFVCEWLKARPIRRKVIVRQYDRISSPLTYGVMRPVILLPKTLDVSDRQQMSFILEHEFVHICRFDMLFKVMVAVCLCIHWFNPLVWVFFILFNRDLELSCDEVVIGNADKAMRADYARTLLNMEEHRIVPNLLFSSFSKNAMEERIVAIMKPKKYTLLGIVGALALVVLIGAGFLTSAKAAESQTHHQDEHQNDSAVHHEDEHQSDSTVHHEDEHQSDSTVHHEDEHHNDSAVHHEEEHHNDSAVHHEEEHHNDSAVHHDGERQETMATCTMIWPTESITITATYGERVHPITGEIRACDHICIKGEKGDNVYAAMSGTVTAAEYESPRGNHVILTNENGMTTVYAHLLDFTVSVGDTVNAGDVIGTIGATGLATGPNLAFWAMVDGKTVDPMSFEYAK